MTGKFSIDDADASSLSSSSSSSFVGAPPSRKKKKSAFAIDDIISSSCSCSERSASPPLRIAARNEKKSSAFTIDDGASLCCSSKGESPSQLRRSGITQKKSSAFTIDDDVSSISDACVRNGDFEDDGDDDCGAYFLDLCNDDDDDDFEDDDFKDDFENGERRTEECIIEVHDSDLDSYDGAKKPEKARTSDIGEAQDADTARWAQAQQALQLRRASGPEQPPSSFHAVASHSHSQRRQPAPNVPTYMSISDLRRAGRFTNIDYLGQYGGISTNGSASSVGMSDAELKREVDKRIAKLVKAYSSGGVTKPKRRKQKKRALAGKGKKRTKTKTGSKTAKRQKTRRKTTTTATATSSSFTSKRSNSKVKRTTSAAASSRSGLGFAPASSLLAASRYSGPSYIGKPSGFVAASRFTETFGDGPLSSAAGKENTISITSWEGQGCAGVSETFY